MSKLRLLQVVLAIGIIVGALSIRSEAGGAILVISILGLILVRLARFIWRD